VGRRWRFFRTATGATPVRDFLTGSALPAGDRDEILAAMKDVQINGLVVARHLRGEIYEVRANGARAAYRVLFAVEGAKGQVLLAVSAFTKNLSGVWSCMRHEIPRMLERGGGSIVNCASVAGLVGFATVPAYVASKHGVVGLTKTAALEYATDGIRVNAVCPGVIDTEMVERFTGNQPDAEAAMIATEPVGRMGRADEIADAVVWLCSSHSSFVTGQAIAVDGGFVAR
jgi:NAD(P)-dependent dehydrogenase (short-subunit alcohol dehydrogenase family)